MPPAGLAYTIGQMAFTRIMLDDRPLGFGYGVEARYPRYDVEVRNPSSVKVIHRGSLESRNEVLAPVSDDIRMQFSPRMVVFSKRSMLLNLPTVLPLCWAFDFATVLSLRRSVNRENQQPKAL